MNDKVMALQRWFRKLDGRIFLTSSHILLLIISLMFFNLQRTGLQILLAFPIAIATELGLNSWLKKYPKATVADRTLSATSEAAGLLILINSPFAWYHAAAAFVAVSSKYLFVRANGSHIFNPTNFAIVVSLTVLPFEWLSLWPDEYSRNLYPITHVIFFGLLATIWADTWRVSLAYATVILLLGAGLSHFSIHEFVYWSGAEFGAIGFIFLFLMITDPKTVPKSPIGQLSFGAGVAATAMCLKYYQFVYHSYTSLFIVTLGSFIGSLILKHPRRVKSESV